MLLSALLFAAMTVCIKYASPHFHAIELVCYRGAIGILFTVAVCRGQGVSMRTTRPWMHAWRSLVGVVSLASWFYAIALLPVATAMTLNYMSGVWLTVLVLGGSLLLGPFLQSRWQTLLQQVPMLLCVLISFVGVILLLRPSLDQNQFLPVLMGLLSGITAAFAYLQVAALGRLGEPAARTVLYFSVGATVAGALGMMLTGASAWLWPSALWLLPIGLLAAGGQLCMTRAYSHGSTLLVANLSYAGIVFAALFGLVLFDDTIPAIGWVGMALIISSACTATSLRSRALSTAKEK